jgi:CTP synthase
MNPIEHGEVFVTDDGDETDQDIGNYERFLNANLASVNYMTTGRVYLSVIQNERSMKYKGKCVQVVPDVPNEIIRRIERAAEENDADITTIEIGGTVGEYENILFLEAARMMKLKNPDDVAFVLVSYLPVPSHLGEMKTKPTQHASRALNSTGINADMIIARGPSELDKPRREKLAVFCGVRPEHCISAPDVASIYEVPLKLEEQDAGNSLLNVLGLKPRPSNLRAWEDLVADIRGATHQVKIAVVGKYFGTGNYTLSDSYISVIEAVKHAAWHHGAKPVMDWIDSEAYESKAEMVRDLQTYDGIIVPGGVGHRGVEGILHAIRFAREKKIPYFGLCYGMQLASIEFARNVLGKHKANTVEIDPKTPYPIIHINPRQAKNVRENRYGGTMRLGAYECKLKRGSLARAAYGADMVSERHRHRYEFNNEYREMMDRAGFRIAGVNPETDLVEIVELKGHPFFVGTQFHPELKSRPMRPHPLFVAFVGAAIRRR